MGGHKSVQVPLDSQESSDNEKTDPGVQEKVDARKYLVGVDDHEPCVEGVPDDQGSCEVEVVEVVDDYGLCVEVVAQGD